MTEAMKAKLDELKNIAEADITEAQKNELSLLETIAKQDVQLAERQTFINTKNSELDKLKAEMADVKPEDKVALEAQVADKQAVIDSLISAQASAKDANEKLLKFSPTPSGDQSTVDQPTVDALEDKLFAASGGKEAMEKAVESMTDSEYADFASNLPYRMKVMSAAMSSVGGDETVRSAWRKKEEDKGTPRKDADERLKELFGNEQRQHRKLHGGGGSAGRTDLRPAAPKKRVMDTRTY